MTSPKCELKTGADHYGMDDIVHSLAVQNTHTVGEQEIDRRGFVVKCSVL